MPAASSRIAVTVSAILLAAGESTRMGQQKALLPWQGTTLLEYQLAQLADVEEINEIVVVTGHEPEAIARIVERAPRARVAHNANYKSGKVSSIQAGLRAIATDTEAVLLLNVDQPRSSAIHGAVIASHVAKRVPITVPAHDGHRGHPVLVARLLFDELLAISEETQGIRAVMRRHESEINVVEIDDASVTLDLNTPDDVQAAQ